MRKFSEIIRDPDIKRSVTYLAISVAVSAIRAMVGHYRQAE